MSVTGWGGKRAGAGRRVNPLKTTRIAAELIERAKLTRGSEAAPTPLEYVLCQMWNPENPADVRFQAAKEALPYCHPKLSSVTVEDNTPRLVVEFIDFNNQVVATSPSVTAVTQQVAIEAALSDEEPEHTEHNQHIVSPSDG